MTAFTIQAAEMPSKVVASGPRQSIYPVDQLIAAGPGNAFAIPLRDENGNAYEGEDLKAKSSQRQSQMSSLAKTRKAKLVTRLITDANDNPFVGQEVPLLGVWYAGPADETKRRKKAGSEVPAAPADEAAPELPTL